jgi:hypothetical protein
MKLERHESEYSKKLRDPRWQKRRLEVMQRDSFHCVRCGDGASTLHVHHLWYESGHDPWDYPLKALVTLCETCHEEDGDLLAQETAALVGVVKRCGAMAGAFNELMDAFSPAAFSEKAFDEYEWSTLCWTIRRLTKSWVADGDEWKAAVADFRAWCAKGAQNKK